MKCQSRLDSSDVIERPIPGHEIGYPLAHTGGRLIAYLPLQLRHIGKGVRHIPRLQGQQLADSCLAGSRLNGLNVLGELNRAVVTNVEDPEWSVTGGRIRLVAVPVKIRLGDVIAGANHPFHDVIDIGEIASVVAMVEHLNRLAGENVAGKQE